MFGSNRDLVLLMAGLAIAGCLMAVGLVLATSHLLFDQQEIAAGVSADLRSIRGAGRDH